MWAAIPAAVREFIYTEDIPLHVARVEQAAPDTDEVVRVAGIIQRGDEFLFIRNCRKDREWEFPGGRLEPGETPTEAIEREVQEETGYSVADSIPQAAFLWVFTDKTIVQLVFSIELGEQTNDPAEDEVCGTKWSNTVPENVSFGRLGSDTYEFIMDSDTVEVTVSEMGTSHPEEEEKDTSRVNKKSLAVSGAVAGAIAAGLAGKLWSDTNKEAPEEDED